MKIKFLEQLQLMQERYDIEIKKLEKIIIEQEKKHQKEMADLQQQIIASKESVVQHNTSEFMSSIDIR